MPSGRSISPPVHQRANVQGNLQGAYLIAFRVGDQFLLSVCEKQLPAGHTLEGLEDFVVLRLLGPEDEVGEVALGP